jgi:hypothetical protein
MLAMRLGWDGTGGEAKILEVLENADAKSLVGVWSSAVDE